MLLYVYMSYIYIYKLRETIRATILEACLEIMETCESLWGKLKDMSRRNYGKLSERFLVQPRAAGMTIQGRHGVQSKGLIQGHAIHGRTRQGLRAIVG